MSTDSTGVVPIWWPVAPLVIHEVFHPGKPYQSPQDVFLGYDDPRIFCIHGSKFSGEFLGTSELQHLGPLGEPNPTVHGTEISTTFWEGCSKLFQFQVFF